MTSSLSSLRYEKKLLVEGFSLAEVLNRVKRHPCAFREVYPARVVNNIYLDSPSRRDYHDHVNGTSDRTKTRVRWYGLQAAEQPRLERKFKRGLVSGKETYPLPMRSQNGDDLRSLLESAFDTAALPPLLRSNLRHREPALFNRYHRHYFVSRDGSFRLTVDSNLQFAGVQHIHRRVQSAPAPILIIELKFGPEIAERAELVSNAFPFRVARFSKYIMGIDRIR